MSNCNAEMAFWISPRFLEIQKRKKKQKKRTHFLTHLSFFFSVSKDQHKSMDSRILCQKSTAPFLFSIHIVWESSGIYFFSLYFVLVILYFVCGARHFDKFFRNKKTQTNNKCSSSSFFFIFYFFLVSTIPNTEFMMSAGDIIQTMEKKTYNDITTAIIATVI